MSLLFSVEKKHYFFVFMKKVVQNHVSLPSSDETSDNILFAICLIPIMTVLKKNFLQTTSLHTSKTEKNNNKHSTCFAKSLSILLQFPDSSHLHLWVVYIDFIVQVALLKNRKEKSTCWFHHPSLWQQISYPIMFSVNMNKVDNLKDTHQDPNSAHPIFENRETKTCVVLHPIYNTFCISENLNTVYPLPFRHYEKTP